MYLPPLIIPLLLSIAGFAASILVRDHGNLIFFFAFIAGGGFRVYYHGKRVPLMGILQNAVVFVLVFSVILAAYYGFRSQGFAGSRFAVCVGGVGLLLGTAWHWPKYVIAIGVGILGLVLVQLNETTLLAWFPSQTLRLYGITILFAQVGATAGEVFEKLMKRS